MNLLVRLPGLVLRCLPLTMLVLSVHAQSRVETVHPLPAPTGPNLVGTTIVRLTDSSRADADFPGGRPVILQLWYPAARTGDPAPYLVEAGLGPALRRAGYYGVDSAALDTWSRLKTHAGRDTPPAAGRHPLLAFSVGLGVIRANYTSLAEELASHGYVVAAVESPLQGAMMLPGGTLLADTAGRFGTAEAHRLGVASWAADISFVVDRLRAGSVPAAAAAVARGVDWSRLGALGHSSGGLVAATACERDARFRACVDMDGGLADPAQEPLAEFVHRGATRPLLLLRSQPLYDDTTLARRGMTRAQWEERGRAGQAAQQVFLARSTAPVWVASVAGTGHFSFSDGPFVMPSTITRFGGRIIEETRGWLVITRTLRAWFDTQLGGGGPNLRALGSELPELMVTPPPG